MQLSSIMHQFSSVQPFSHTWLFATPWTAARQASLSITDSRSLLKLMSIESVMPSNHLILCRPLLLPPYIHTSCIIHVHSNTMALVVKNPPANAGHKRRRVKTREGQIPRWRGWQPTPVSLLGESHGQRSLVGYSPWGHKESETTEAI